MKVLAVTLTKETYGYYSLIMSIITLITILPFTALIQGISRYISIYKDKNKYVDFISSVFWILILIMISYIFIFIVLNSFISFGKWNDIFYMIMLLGVTEILKIFFRTVNNTNRERKNITLSSLVEFFLKIGLLLFLTKFYAIGIFKLLSIFIISNFLSILVMYFKNKELIFFSFLTLKEFKVYLLRIWIFSSPLVIWAIFGWLRDMSNRWYLDYFMDKEQVALFAMMSSIAMIAPTALQGLIGSFFIPVLYQNENKTKGYTRKFLFKLIPIVFVIFILSFIVTYIFKNEIILIVADEKYLEISWMLPWMFLTFCIYTLSMMTTYELFAHKQTKKLIWSSILPGIISILCGYFLVKEYGINGALYNYIITYLSYALLTYYVVLRYIKSNKLETL